MNTFNILLDILITLLAFSFLLCFVRLYLGPDVPNRTVAFDTIAVHAVGIMGLIAVRYEARSLLDVAIVTAVLGFLGTTMLARYWERVSGRYRELLDNDEDKDDDNYYGDDDTYSHSRHQKKPTIVARSVAQVDGEKTA